MGYRLQSAAALGAATAAVLFATTTPASAATGPIATTTLSPLTGFSSIVADSVHHQVFVSGTGTSPVEVADFTGQPVTTLPALNGATSLALSQDDGILYAAISGTDEIAAVNTTTLQEVAVYFTGAAYDPLHLAVVGKDIAFSYGVPGNSGIGVLNPETLTINTRSESFYGAPTLAASPSAPNTLVAGDIGESPSTIESFDVSTGAPVEISKSNPWAQSDGCENLHQLAVAANGTDVIAACGAPYYGSSLTLNGMTEDATYRTGPYPGSVAVAPENGAIAIGVYGSSSSVYLFTPGTSTATATYQIGGSGAYGLAWNQSGSTLFAVSTPEGSSTPTLTVINVS